MIKKSITALILFFFCVSISFAQDAKPRPADELFKEALVKSNQTGKNVFLLFHATWCGWCKKLDKAMESAELKKIFDDNYVIIHLDILEHTPALKESHQNPGGEEMFNKLTGGKSTGIPFYVFFNKAGEKLCDANAMPKNQNIGYPGNAEEIEAFMGLIKKSAPKMPEADFNKIKEYLKTAK